jgi:hypothetical protein
LIELRVKKKLKILNEMAEFLHEIAKSAGRVGKFLHIESVKKMGQWIG